SYNSSPKFANTIPGRQLGAIQPIRSVEEIVALLGPPPYSYVFREGVQSQSPECLDCNAMVGKPVCGSDGRTYSNEKCLKSAACQNELKNVRTVAAGPCKFTFTAVPSTKPTRTNFTSTSITIECPAICSDDKKFVCASDGITYPNDCLMRMEACLFKKALQKSFDGKCSEEEDDVDSDDNDEDEDNEDNDNDVEERTESESQKQPESTTAQAVATTSGFSREKSAVYF
ncbi:unnamed protein product, partial [Notodromas monacha]